MYEVLDMKPEELDNIEKLAKISSARRKRTIIGSALIATSLLLMQVATLILIGAVDLDINVAVVMIVVSPFILAGGLYLILHMPPIVLE
jgi:hypothetical protein